MPTSLRGPELGWRVGIILTALTLAGLILTQGKPNLGVDLRGGSNLIYEVDEEATMVNADPSGDPGDPDTASFDNRQMKALIEALQRRINPGGVREIVLRPYGQRQVEIIIPEASDAELEQIKQKIVKAGLLRFRMLADDRKHAALVQMANEKHNAGQRFVRDKNSGEIKGEWIRIGRESTGQADDPGRLRFFPETYSTIRELRSGVVEALCVQPPEQLNIMGQDLRGVSFGFDESASPCVNFTMNLEGAGKMGSLTRLHLPDQQTGRYYHLGIVLDDELLSAPRDQQPDQGPRANYRAVLTGRSGISRQRVERGQTACRAEEDSHQRKQHQLTAGRGYNSGRYASHRYFGSRRVGVHVALLPLRRDCRLLGPGGQRDADAGTGLSD